MRTHTPEQPAPHSTPPRTPHASLAIIAVLLAAASGCYNGDALVDRVRNDALRHRLEEIDLGRYSITMPQDMETSETVEVEMHLFGSIARYKQKAVDELLDADQPMLRHRAVMAVRTSGPEDFTDPDLTDLRGRLLEAVNGMLEEPAVQSVGFREIRFVRR
ncbi:MAG: flagellar basal body-associated FliL family protein [Planctomycetota bacterium]